MSILEQRRILILTADAGFGHRNAANAIALALDRRYGAACEVSVVNPMVDRRVPAVVRDAQFDYDRIVRETPRLYRAGYDLSNAAVPSAVMDGALVLMFFEVLRDLVRQYRPHVIVTTYPLYQAPLGVLFALTRWRAPLITVVTDLVSVHRLWFSDAVDLCLVPTGVVRELAMKASLAPGKVRVTGIPVDPSIEEETRPKGVIRDELGWRKDLSTILFVGSKRVANLGNAVRAVNHARLGVQIVAVAGGDDELFERFQHTTWHTEAHIYNFATNLPTMMQAADLMVCKAGGLTVSEALACGLPMLFIDVAPGQEVGNAEYVVQAGAGIMASDALAVLESVYHWLDDEGAELAKRQQAAHALGRASAAHVTAELVWSLAEKTPGEGPSQYATRRVILRQWLDQHGISWRERLSK